MQNETRPQRALLVSLDTGEFDAQASLRELEELSRTAGADPVLTLTQKRPAPDTATCLGSGMVEQAAELCRQEEIDLLLFDRELTPTQIRNLEKACQVRVIDRTTLILDIFAQRARSKEGKLQVELAQLRYLLPRLGGQGTALSRLGGGIGTRGPGETKLETDRRHIRRRIGSLKEQLKEVEAARGIIDRRRKKGRHCHRGFSGLHQRGEEHPDEPAHPGGGAGGGQALRHPGPHRPGLEAALRQDRHAHRHGGGSSGGCPTTWWRPSSPPWSRRQRRISF